MANALVTGVRVSERSQASILTLVYSCYFWGAGVSVDVEGVPYDILIDLPTTYTLGDLKSKLIAAVQAKATELGFTVAETDADLPSYDQGQVGP